MRRLIDIEIEIKTMLQYNICERKKLTFIYIIFIKNKTNKKENGIIIITIRS